MLPRVVLYKLFAGCATMHSLPLDFGPSGKETRRKTAYTLAEEHILVGNQCALLKEHMWKAEKIRMAVMQGLWCSQCPSSPSATEGLRKQKRGGGRRKMDKTTMEIMWMERIKI